MPDTFIGGTGKDFNSDFLPTIFHFNLSWRHVRWWAVVTNKPAVSNSICFHTLMDHFQAREALETRREEEQGRLEVNKSKVLSLPCFARIKHIYILLMPWQQEEEKSIPAESTRKRGCRTQWQDTLDTVSSLLSLFRKLFSQHCQFEL